MAGDFKRYEILQKEIPYNDFLIDQFKRLFQSFAMIYNKEKDRNGSLFQKRFKRILIKNEFRWQHILAYIHHNPIHHKFRKQYNDWKFSSYLAFLSNADTVVAREAVLERFDKNLEVAMKLYIEHHRDFKIDKERDDLYLDRF